MSKNHLNSKTCTNSYYFMCNFYQINRDSEIQTRDRLVIKTLIPYQRTISTEKFKLLSYVPIYNLYYYLIKLSWKTNKKLRICLFLHFKSAFKKLIFLISNYNFFVFSDLFWCADIKRKNILIHFLVENILKNNNYSTLNYPLNYK